MATNGLTSVSADPSPVYGPETLAARFCRKLKAKNLPPSPRKYYFKILPTRAELEELEKAKNLAQVLAPTPVTADVKADTLNAATPPVTTPVTAVVKADTLDSAPTTPSIPMKTQKTPKEQPAILKQARSQKTSPKKTNSKAQTKPKPKTTKPKTKTNTPKKMTTLGSDRFCIQHSYENCDCSGSKIMYVPRTQYEVSRHNTISEHIAEEGAKKGIVMKDRALPERKIPKRKSENQRAKARSFGFKVRENAFPELTDEPTEKTTPVWKTTSNVPETAGPRLRLRNRHARKFTTLNVTLDDLHHEEAPVLVPLNKSNLDKWQVAKNFVESQRFYKDNGILTDTEEEKDVMDGPTTAGKLLMKLLPDTLVTSLEDFKTDPLELVTSLLGISGYVTALVAMSKQENNPGVKVGMGMMAIDHLYRIYKVVDKVHNIKASFEELSGALTVKMSDLEKEDQPNYEFNLKIAKTVSAIGCFFAAMFGITPKQEMQAFLTFRKASDETFDMITVLLWECLDIDLKGDKLLAKQVIELANEGKKYADMLSQDLWGKNLEDAEDWLTKAIRLDRAIGRETDSTLKAMIGKITGIVSDARKADAGQSAIPVPACLGLYGEPGVGKSFYTGYLYQQLSNHFGTDNRVFDLNTGKHFAHYSGQQWGLHDEFGATEKSGDSSFVPIINQCLSGNAANIPGAAIEDKHQYTRFTAITLISNKEPKMLNLGLTAEAMGAFASRLIYARFEDPTYDSSKSRDQQTGRKKDFSHARIYVTEANGDINIYTGDKFYLRVAEVIQRNQDNFVDRKDMFGAGARVPQAGRLVRDTPSAAWFNNSPVRRDQCSENDLMEDTPFVVAGRDGRLPSTPLDAGGVPYIRTQTYASSLPRQERIMTTHETQQELRGQMEQDRDSMDALIGRTLWLCGPPGNGKTAGLVPFAERYCDGTDTKVINVRKGYRFKGSLPPPVGAVYILDDVVDPTTKEGQQAYCEFFDHFIAPTNSTSICVSNYGPVKSFKSKAWNAVTYMFSNVEEYEQAPVLIPAFGRRSGWTGDGGSRFITTDDRLTFTNGLTGEVLVIDEFITSYLSGVIGDAPVNMHNTLPTVMPFTQANSDVWLTIPANASSTEVVLGIRQSCSPRVLPMALRVMSKINVDQFDIKVGVNIYKACLNTIPDIKFKVSVGPVVLVGHGKDLYLSKSTTGPYVVSWTQAAGGANGHPYVLTSHGNHVITRPDYIKFLGKNLIPSSRATVAIFNALSHCEALDPVNWALLEKEFPLNFEETMSISTKKMWAQLTEHKNTILGTAGVGALITALAMALKYAFSSDSDNVKLTEDADVAEAGKAGSRVRVKVRKGPNKVPKISDTEFENALDKQEYDYAYDGINSKDAKLDFIDGDVFITHDYAWKGKKKQARFNTSSRTMEYGTEYDDVMDAAYHAFAEDNPAQASFVNKLIQNIILIKGINGSSYATMLCAEVGMVPLHTVDDNSGITASWLNADGTYTVKNVKILYRCADREVAFFTVLNEEGYGHKGPFKELFSNCLNINEISTVTRATMLAPNNIGGHDTLIGDFKLEVTIENKINADIIQHWTTNIGYVHYGNLRLPTMRGRCGLPYFAEVNGKYALLGVHAVSRPSHRKIGAIIYCSELWNEVCAGMLKEPRADMIDPPSDSADAVREHYVRAEAFDKDSGDNHEVFPTYVPKQIMEKMTEITDEMLHPHGPGQTLIGGFANKMPYDTKADYVNLDIPGMKDLFVTEKIPTLSEKEILEKMPERITKDALGNLHVPYTRLQAGNTTTGMPDISDKIASFAEELADILIEDMGLESEILNPLSVQEAISGTRSTPTFKRESAAGGVLGTIFSQTKKVDFVDYDEKTREITWKGVHGKFIERWTQDQYELAKDLVRLHIPCTAGLKSEKLLFEKLHKKRVFMITSLPTWINQKKVFLPVQNLLVNYKNTDFTRFPLVFDPITQADELCNWLYQDTEVAAAFDWQSYDQTVDANLLHGMGYFTKRFYDRLGQKGNKVGNVAITLMQDMAAGSYVLGKSWLKTKGGVESGSGCTSLIDSVTVMIAIFYAMMLILAEDRVKITLRELFPKVKTLHGGDDILMAVARKMAKMINLDRLCAKVNEVFGMTLTLDTKKEGAMEWKTFAECSFLSRHFIRHPTYPVWLSKLKEESVGSILNWSNAKSANQQARQVEAAAVEVFPYGEEIYNKYRTSSMGHFKKMNIHFSVPSYKQTADFLGTAIMCKEHPSEFEERFLLESVAVTTKKQLRPMDLSKVVPQTELARVKTQTTMPYKQSKSVFIKTILEHDNITDLLMTPEFEQMAAVGKLMPPNVATIKLKDKTTVMSVPRNTPSFWTYLAFRSKLTDLDPATVALYSQFVKEWKQVPDSKCHTTTLKQLKNLFYLLTSDQKFNFRTLQQWATDMHMDTADANNKGIGQTHNHICIKCGEYYTHRHTGGGGHHKQFPNQCTNLECEWIQTEADFVKVPSRKVFVEKYAKARFMAQLMKLDTLECEFGLISLYRGVTNGAAELICQAGISKLMFKLKDDKELTKEEVREVLSYAQKYYGDESFDILFPPRKIDQYIQATPIMDDMMDAGPADEELPLSPPQEKVLVMRTRPDGETYWTMGYSLTPGGDSYLEREMQRKEFAQEQAMWNVPNLRESSDIVKN